MRVLVALCAIAVASPRQEPVADAAATTGLYARLAQAHGLPLLPPDRPDQHYELAGEISFVLGPDQRVTQACEVSLGGPFRLRYLLSAGDHKNVFLLHDRQTAWMRASATAFESYPAGELASQNWLRWTACRFPWDFREQLAGVPEDSVRLELAGPLGPFTIELGEAGLPHRFRLGEVTLVLGDWQPLASGARLPRSWEWDGPSGHQIERFERLQDRVLHFDRSFTPRGKEPVRGGWLTRLDTPGAPAWVETSIEVVERPAVVVLRGPADGAWLEELAAAQLEGPRWLWLDAGGDAEAMIAFPAGASPARLPEGVERRELAAGRYLRWLSVAPALDRAAAARSLRDSATASGIEAAGPVWWRLPPADANHSRRELLLPLR